MKLIRLLAVAFFLSLSNSAIADDATALGDRFKDYWRVFSSANFDAAVDLIHPHDVAMAKAELLPVFLEAAKSKDPNVRALGDLFFTGIPDAAPERDHGQGSLCGIQPRCFCPDPTDLGSDEG